MRLTRFLFSWLPTATPRFADSTTSRATSLELAMALNSPLSYHFQRTCQQAPVHFSCRPVQKVLRRSSAGSAILATITLDCPRTYIIFHQSRSHASISYFRALSMYYCQRLNACEQDLFHVCGRAGEAVRDPGGIASSSKMRRLFGPLLAACESIKAMSAERNRGSDYRPRTAAAAWSRTE